MCRVFLNFLISKIIYYLIYSVENKLLTTLLTNLSTYKNYCFYFLVQEETIGNFEVSRI